ncbi:MAG TPA: hypothetical protein VMT82_06030 [candidate division Zixibacteria bacterium]|nr:hypothetical protein [candidate division Zixibacteria bacterium]
MANLRPGEIGTFTLRVSQAPQYQQALCFPGDKLEVHREAGGLVLRTAEGELAARIPRRHARSMVAFLNYTPHRQFTAEVVRISRCGLLVRFGVLDQLEMELPDLSKMSAHTMVC